MDDLQKEWCAVPPSPATTDSVLRTTNKVEPVTIIEADAKEE